MSREKEENRGTSKAMNLAGFLIGLVLGAVIFFLFGGKLHVSTGFRGEELSYLQIGKLILTSAVFAFIGAMFGSMLLVVKQKQALIIELFGKFQSVKQAGLRLKLPSPFARVAGAVNLQVNLLQENVGVKSKDNAFLTVPVKLHFQVIDRKESSAFYELRNPATQIITYIVNMLRAEANNMDMDQIFSSKDEFKNTLTTGLSEKLEKYGYKIVDVLVDDPQPSDALKKAFDQVLAAKRDQEASEQEKIAIMNRVVGKAEAEAKSITLKATAYVEGRKILAKGNSAAIKEFCEGLVGVSHEYALQYFAGLDMRDAIRDAATSGSVVVIPADMTGSGMGQTISMLKALDKKEK